MQSFFFKDARYFQLIFQTFFLGYGILFLHWNSEWWLYVTYFGTSIITQFFCELIFKKNKGPLFSSQWWDNFNKGLPSALISSFGLTLLLKTNLFYIAAFAATVSILSKYIFRINGKHVFNPSALGIVVAVFVTGNAWISPAQWGSGTVIFFTTLCLGSIVVTRVQKLDVSLAFFGTFAALFFARQIIYLGWPLDFYIQSLSTGSLLLFSFFMITDPKTTPNHPLVRILWSMAIAAIAFYLAAFKFLNGAPILVLVCMQLLVPLLDKIFTAKQFDWHIPIGSIYPFKA